MMLCIGGVIPGNDVILDSLTDGYSCNMLQFIRNCFAFINKLVQSLFDTQLQQCSLIKKSNISVLNMVPSDYFKWRHIVKFVQ